MSVQMAPAFLYVTGMFRIHKGEIGSAGVGSNGRAYIRDGNITISNDGATYVDMGNGWSMGNNGKACYTTKGYTYCN